MKRSHLLIAAVAGAAIVLVVVLFFALRSSETTTAGTAPLQVELEKPAPEPVARPAADQKLVTPLELQQKGLFTVDYKSFEAAALKDRYSFIADALKQEEAPDSPGFLFEPQLPENIDVSEINIPSKQLNMVVVYANSPKFCTGKYCLLNLYVKRPSGYENYLGLMATKNSYVMVNDKSVSLITCESTAGYNEWRLGDGTLDGPIPPNSPGHFVPVGIFKHDKVAPCP